MFLLGLGWSILGARHLGLIRSPFKNETKTKSSSQLRLGLGLHKPKIFIAKLQLQKCDINSLINEIIYLNNLQFIKKYQPLNQLIYHISHYLG